MHIWTDIFTRELLMLVLLGALGSAPASFLGPRFTATARVAMAPILGLCVGTCVFTTLIWFTAADNTYWLLPVLGVASLAVALRRGWTATVTSMRSRRSPAEGVRAMLSSIGVFDAVALVAVCVIVAAPLSYTLHERHSVGPTGVQIWDAVDYAAFPDAMMGMSIRDAEKPQPANASLTRLIWSSYAQGYQNVDAMPLSANTNALLGLWATDTQGLYLIVFLIAGALGGFAAVRYFAPRPRWAAPLAGVLFAGPFFLQVMSDGSQAAICGLGLILPIAAVGYDALRRPAVRTLVLFALLGSGLMALYPLFVPGIAFVGAFVLLVRLTTSWWSGRLSVATLSRAAAMIAFVIALIAVFDLVSFSRDLRYWRAVLNGTYYNTAGVPYHLPYSVLPGWLLQTREFYDLSELGSTSFKQVLLGVILPGTLIAAIVAGVKRNRTALILIPCVLVFAAMAEYVSASHHCSYCADRTLLPIAPLSIGLLAIGVAALATARSGFTRAIGIGLAVIALVAVAQRTREERLRVADAGYFLNVGNTALLTHLPSHAGPVDVEAYGEDGSGGAPGELPLVYLLAWERNREQVSLPTEYDDFNALAYFAGPDPANPHFDPGYRFVLTRIGGVQTARRAIARTGALALEERTQPLDVTVTAGLEVPFQRSDPAGVPAVVGALRLIVSGGTARPAWISLRFHTTVPVSVPRQPGVTVRASHGSLSACVRATGAAPLRHGTIALNAALAPGPLAHEPFPVAAVPQGVQLVAMSAAEHCSL